MPQAKQLSSKASKQGRSCFGRRWLVGACEQRVR
jgi:hypothetical protein